jgi:hypothetical protein
MCDKNSSAGVGPRAFCIVVPVKKKGSTFVSRCEVMYVVYALGIGKSLTATELKPKYEP